MSRISTGVMEEEVESPEGRLAESSMRRRLNSMFIQSRASLAAEVDSESSRMPRRPLAAGDQFGKYTLIEELGGGAMGTVYHAYDPRLRRAIALKILSRRSSYLALADQDRQFREAQALAQIKHPNVVRVHDVGIVDGVVWIDMELVSGDTLKTWAARRSWQQILGVLIQAAEGVAAIHARGVIHRDLKPDNVMLTKGGVVQILDFGLADEQVAESAATQPTSTPSLHRTRAVGGGTPVYMAPEQHRGSQANALTDQFSFCVMAWELMFAMRPFANPEAIERGERGPPPPGTQVPGWLRRAIERGLADVPGQRWESMNMLREAMRRGQAWGRRRTWLIPGAGVVVALAAIVVGGVWKHRSDMAHGVRLCEVAGAQIREVWKDDVRQALRVKLMSTGNALAATTADKVSSLFDKYAKDWEQEQTDVCLDASIRGRWPLALVDRAQWCLEARYLSLASLVDALAGGGANGVQMAVAAALSLPRIDQCSDREFLEQMPDPPRDRREEIREVRAELLRLSRLEFSGEYEAGVRAARVAVVRAKALHAPSVVAAALYQLGLLLVRRGAYGEAEQTLEEAFFAANDAGAVEIVPNAGALLVGLLGQLARYKDALRWERHTRQALDQLHGSDGSPTAVLRDSTAAALDNSVAVILKGQGDYEGAGRRFTQALTTWERVFGANHYYVAYALNNLAEIQRKLGRYHEAAQIFERALVTWEATLGAQHPNTAMSLYNLALVYYDLGRFEGARTLLTRSLAIREATVGPASSETADTLDALGLVSQELGEFDAAEHRHGQALELRKRSLSSTHPDLARSFAHTAELHVRLGEFGQAEQLLERALEIREAAHSAGDPSLAPILVAFGDLWLAAGSPARARAPLERALRLRETALGRDHPDVAPVLVGLARIAEAEGRLAEALELATRATSMYTGREVPPSARAGASMILARVLWIQGTARPQAIELAGAACDAYRAAGPAYQQARAQAEQWLDGRTTQ